MTRRRLVENFRDGSGARALRETFTARPAEWVETFDWQWPGELHEVGECLGVMYKSDKWKKKGNYEDYKHVSEAEQRLYLAPGFELAGRDGKPLKVAAELERVPPGMMPDTIATLALFMGIQCRLYERRGRELYLPNGDAGLFEFHVPHAKLAAGKTQNGTTFLSVYDKTGPCCLVFGVELDVEKDGIVG